VAAAACMPCHDDWLNDLSSMPPVSVTMQPRNLLLADVPLELPDELLDGELPHAAASSETAPTATTALNVPLTDTSSAGATCGRPKDRRLVVQGPAGRGKSSRMSPPGLPEQ
jgi:hypothetical protein